MSRTVAKFIFPIVLVGVLVTALFGFAVMMNGMGHVMVGCFGSAPGTNCSVLSPIEHFEAHFQTFQYLTTAIVQVSSLLAAFLLILAAVVFLLLKGDRLLEQQPFAISCSDTASPQRIQLTHWLALREKRDPSLVYAMN